MCRNGRDMMNLLKCPKIAMVHHLDGSQEAIFTLKTGVMNLTQKWTFRRMILTKFLNRLDGGRWVKVKVHHDVPGRQRCWGLFFKYRLSRCFLKGTYKKKTP